MVTHDVSWVGAIFSLESAVNVSGSNFFSNKAKFGGGAIYWIIDEEHEDHSVHFPENAFLYFNLYSIILY